MKYSGEQINKAGQKLLREDLVANEPEFDAVLDVLSFWRSEHDLPLKHALAVVQRISLQKDRKAIFGKRLKRFASIVKKLQRFRSMDLRNMQDIGGCRAIVTNQKKLYQILRELKRIDEFRWKDGRHRVKDYIEKPKEDGYRSVHIIGNFPNDSQVRRKVEVQLRTFIQHYWATALEIVDLFTDQALKSNKGDADWRSFFRIVGEHFAVMDEIHLFDQLDPLSKSREYQKRVRSSDQLQDSAKLLKAICKKLRVGDCLEAFTGSVQVVGDQLSKSNASGFVLLRIRLAEKLIDMSVFPQPDSKRAEEAYIAAEREAAKTDGVVVALVSSTALGGIKEAYPNYFADSSSFYNHLEMIAAN